MNYKITYVRDDETAAKYATRLMDMDQSKIPERLRLTPEKALRWAKSGEDSFGSKADALQKAKAMARHPDLPCVAIRVRDMKTLAFIFEHGDQTAFYVDDFKGAI